MGIWEISVERYASDASPLAANKEDSTDEKKMRFEHMQELKYIVGHDVSSQVLRENARLMDEFRKNPYMEPRHILWFLPNFDHIYRGGIHTIFKTAQSFSVGWRAKNTFVLTGRRKKSLEELRRMISEAFPLLNYEVIEHADGDDPNKLPASDAAFCTLWTTAYLLVRYNRCKSKYYFVQDYEPSFYPAGSVFALIEQTYRFSFNGIANTPGVAEMYRQYNPWVDYFIPGVDRDIFYPGGEGIKRDSPFRIVFYGRPRNSRNAFILGTEALRRVKAHFGKDVEIISVGADFSSEEFGLEDVIERHGFLLPTIKDVADLYRSAHVGLVFMYSAHPSYQPLEFMASGCVTVTNYNYKNEWILRDNENAIIAGSTVSCVADRIIEVLEDESLRRRTVKGGLATAATLDWEQAFEKIRSFVKAPSKAQGSFIDKFDRTAIF